MTQPPLPNEILNHIVDEVAIAREPGVYWSKSLTACSLVSHSMNYRAQSHLFRQIDLEMGRQRIFISLEKHKKKCQTLCDLLETSTTLSSHIRYLRLGDSSNSPLQISEESAAIYTRLLKALTGFRVESFHFWGSDRAIDPSGSFGQAFTSFIRQTNLLKLSIARAAMSLRLFSSQDTLQHLKLSRISLFNDAVEDRIDTISPSIRMSLRTLSIALRIGERKDLEKAISLNKLISRLAVTSANTLTEFRWIINPGTVVEPFDTHPVDLSILRKLKSLRLFSSAYGPSPSSYNIIHALAGAQEPTIEVFEFFFHEPYKTINDQVLRNQDRWQPIDALLATAAFPHLRRVRVVMEDIGVYSAFDVGPVKSRWVFERLFQHVLEKGIQLSVSYVDDDGNAEDVQERFD